MQTANNTNNYTVEGLVAKYRNFVTEHCPKTYEVFDYVDEKGKFHADDDYIPVSPEANADEQLLAVVYASVAGKNANTKIIEALSKYSDKFFKDALEEDELSFLCSNFSDFVSYTFDHKSDWFMRSVTETGLSRARTRLVKEYINPEEGSTVFIADTEHCELAVQFPGCTIQGFTGWNYNHEEVWALGEIRMFAAGIKSEIVAGEEINEKYTYQLPPKDSVDYIIFRNCENKYFAQQIFGTECTDVNALYDLLKPGGKMLFFAERKRELVGKGDDQLHDFIKRIVKDESVEAIVSYEDEHLFLQNRKDEYIMLVICKSPRTKFLVKNEITSFCQEFEMTCLDDEILWPGFYAAQRPQNGIPLSNIVTLKELRKEKALFQENEKGDWILHESMANIPVVVPAIMAKEYKDANLNTTKLWLPSDPSLEEWEDEIRLVDKPCVLFYGKKDKCVIGYINEIHDDGMATLDSVICLQPNEGVDVRYVATLLLLPEVKDQIISICSGEVNERIFSVIFSKVIVPNHTDKERLAFLAEANYNALISSQKEMDAIFNDRFNKMKKDYINEVRMRKHDIRPHLRQIESSQTLMLHYLENINDVDQLKEALKGRLMASRKALDSISELVDHLADEEHFGIPKRLNIEKFIMNYVADHKNDAFSIQYNFDDVIKQNGGDFIFKLMELAEDSGTSLEQFVKRIDCSDDKNIMTQKSGNYILSLKKYASDQGLSLEHLVSSNILYVNIAPLDLKRLMDNIILNASRHGFDKHRNDYFVSINVKIDVDRDMYQIDFCNNGNPLPVGMTKERYGIKGEKAGKNAGTGNGGHIVKTIIEHYGGDYDVLSSEGLTTIRIYLPKYSLK